MKQRYYIAIDLKSFYASVECQERALDPMTTNLVVADASRTEKTICLAVSPSLKSFGISGRARLFEVVQRVKKVNADRSRAIGHRPFRGSSCDARELEADPELKLDYIAAVPRMGMYMKYSTEIYQIYLKYVAPEDIHVYSIDEVFIDATDYLKTYKVTAHELAMRMIRNVLKVTGITATAGIGTNMYLAKVAMDIVAKHMPADADGVRIAELDEISYREALWSHEPITDFWRVGRGYARKLAEHGMKTMGDVARCSLGKPGDTHNEELLFKLFGVNAELLIDHAWGYEPCTIREVKAYRPKTSSLSSGQVLMCPYDYERTRIIVREMTELLVLDLVSKGLVTDQIVLTIGYDIENLTDPAKRLKYHGEITTDYYGRRVPKHAHGTANMPRHTSSTQMIMDGVMELFQRIVDPELTARRVNISANHLIEEEEVKPVNEPEQLDFFTDYAAREAEQQAEEEQLAQEKQVQKAMLEIQKKFGKNSILKGTNLEEGATTIDRNHQIGGHKA